MIAKFSFVSFLFIIFNNNQIKKKNFHPSILLNLQNIHSNQKKKMFTPPNGPPGPLYVYQPSIKTDEEMEQRRQTTQELKNLWKQIQIEYRAKYLGKWIALANKKVVGVYDNRREAIINANLGANGDVYSAFEITPEDEII